mgnify:CR=1 FL=1
MKRYTLKIELDGCTFEVITEASSDQEAKDDMWLLIRQKLVIQDIRSEPIPNVSLGTKFKNSIKQFLLI